MASRSSSSTLASDVREEQNKNPAIQKMRNAFSTVLGEKDTEGNRNGRLTVKMSAEERTGNPSWYPDSDLMEKELGGEIKPLTNPNFKNEGEDSMHKLAMSWRKNEFESIAFFTKDGKFLGKTQSAFDDPHRVEVPNRLAYRLSKEDGVSIHNHPQSDLSFSHTDIQTWLQENVSEMMVVSKNFIYSIRQKEDNSGRGAPVGKRDTGPRPYQIAKEFIDSLGDEAEIRKTVDSIARAGWIEKGKKVYGDEGGVPKQIVPFAHWNRMLQNLSEKHGFVYKVYRLPKEQPA